MINSLVILMSKNKEATIQFYEGVSEPVVPEIRLTRGKDGSTGQAFFILNIDNTNI